MKIKLTQAIVNGYKIPEDVTARQQELVDEGGTGLYLLVTRSCKTLFWRYRSIANGNKTTHVKLGRADDISLSQARAMVKQLRAETTLGNDPSTKVKASRKALSYERYMLDLYLPYADNHLRAKTAKGYRQMFSAHLHDLKDYKINSISRRQIQELQLKLKDKGLANSTCNRVLSLAKSSYFAAANVFEVFDGRNPAVGIPKLEEQGRERYLSQDELTRLMPVLMEDGKPISRVARMLLCTGCRLNEVLQCRWEHIDIENRVMVIPSSNAKSKKTDSIPLNDAAIQVLEECGRSTPYPFANPATGKPYVSIKKGFQKLMKQAKIEGATAHTMRHTAASMMINAGRSLYDVQKVLRHSSSTVTEKYAHLSQQTVMEASDTISQQLQKAAAGNH